MEMTLADLVALKVKLKSGQIPNSHMYEGVVGYISGAAWADGRSRSSENGGAGVLRGFREHLVVELGKDTPLTWPAIVLQIEGFMQGGRANLGDDRSDHERAISALFRELDAFQNLISEDRLEELLGRYNRISTR